jgi:formylglycine-generating enzyme required for sulfatase activity
MRVRGVRGYTPAPPTMPGFVFIEGGSFDMGDHHNLGGQEHRNDEVPVHTVKIDALYVAACETTNEQYCEFLNSPLMDKRIEVSNGNVYGGGRLYIETNAAVPYSHISWDGQEFSPVDKKGDHPVICVPFEGATAYCNWLSRSKDLDSCYDLSAGICDYSKNGYRLPTEAEWEYAGRGGSHDPYYIYPWGDDPDVSKANWPRSGDPFEGGAMPWTTPVGFYSGQLHRRQDFDWPGESSAYQTLDGSNEYGLYDMAGNVWEWCNDCYVNPYYASSGGDNPTGPASGSPMPDGRPYRVLRSGNWFNGPQGHSRVSNRNPAHFRGPEDPNHPYYHIGFRVVRDYEGDGPRENCPLTPMSQLSNERRIPPGGERGRQRGGERWIR